MRHEPIYQLYISVCWQKYIITIIQSLPVELQSTYYYIITTIQSLPVELQSKCYYIITIIQSLPAELESTCYYIITIIQSLPVELQSTYYYIKETDSEPMCPIEFQNHARFLSSRKNVSAISTSELYSVHGRK